MKTKKFAVLPVVAGLLLSVFSAVPASASPDGDSGKVLKVAVIGDSYTAGNGAGAYPNFNRDGSYYSLNNWGNKYVQWLNDQGVNAQLVAPLAYGGSVADDLLCPQNQGKRQKYDYEAGRCKGTKEKSTKNPGGQIKRLPSDVDIVLLTIGGNDVHFTDIVTQCFARGARDPENCEKQVGKANKNLREKVNYTDEKDTEGNLEASVKEKTETVLRALDGKLKPGAEVVLVGYPLLATNRPYALVNKKTNAEVVDGAVSKTAEKYPAGAEVRALGQEATRLQREIVNEWNAQSGEHVKVTYVGSIASAFAGHEPDPSVHSRNGDDEKKMGLHLGRWINEFFETETREITDKNGKTRIASKNTVSSGNTGMLDHGNAIGGMDNWYHPGVTGHEMIAREIVGVVGVPGAVRGISRGSVSSELVDVAVVVDSTGSMGYVNASLGSVLRRAMGSVMSRVLSGRFAVVSYRDYPIYGDIYDSRVDADFTTSAQTIEDSFYGITGIEHLKDNAQSTVFSGVGEALGLDWRADAHKVMIVVGDAGAREVEQYTGYTAEHMTQLAAAAGGVEVYAIDTHNITTSYGPSLSESTVSRLVEATGGKIYSASTLQDISTFIDDAISDSLSKPSAWLEPTGGYIGEDIIFDARGSYSINGKIVKYEWDGDGDGIYEETTTNGMLTKAFDSPLDTTARVRVTDEKGRAAIATAPVYVTVEPAPVPETDPSTLQDKPGVYEVLDEEAVALFPELAPIAKDASLPETGTNTGKNAPATIHLPQTGTGTKTGIAAIIAILSFAGGIAILSLRRRQTQR